VQPENSGIVRAGDKVPIHPLAVRITHWINAVAIFIMVLSGWRIYNAAPLFNFTFPGAVTLGGWLGGALLWHFAAMWLLIINTIAYLTYGFAVGHFQKNFLPITAAAVLRDIKSALAGKLAHDLGTYNSVQRLSYAGVLSAVIATILSGLVIWKSTQFQLLGLFMGGYEGARLVHFFGMSAIVAFIVVHLSLVLIVPSTFVPMITGWARRHETQAADAGQERS
jgi:thiosulfate reductase cytochrome b subunit